MFGVFVLERGLKMSQCSCFGCCVPSYFFFSFKASAVSAHLFHELMTSHILRCSQPSHQPPETLAASFVNHSSLTNFASQVVFYLLFLSISPLT